MYQVPLLVLLVLLFCGGCGDDQQRMDPLKRAHVDGLNKAAFMNRYKDPEAGIRYADSALTYIADSLPNYGDGYLRACNNRAYCSYMLSDYDGVALFGDTSMMDHCDVHSNNMEVETLIANLLQARLAQRNCDIAKSYQILYDIDQSKVLEHSSQNYLYSYAQAEYYITSLILNYHYRAGSKSVAQKKNGLALLSEIEQRRSELKCDYAQDMALNYAMAHSYVKLCDSANLKNQTYYLGRALDLCIDNLKMLSDSANYNEYQMADVLQMLGFICSDPNIDSMAWTYNQCRMDHMAEILWVGFGYDLMATPDWAMSLFEESAALFWQLDDPYQQLGAVVATARYAMAVGDTALARDYYSWIVDQWHAGGRAALSHHFAPKFEAMLYAGLITSRYPGTASDYQAWFDKEINILNYISQNQKADFMLQNELAKSKEVSNFFGIFARCVTLLALALLVVLLLLRRRTRALAREKIQLQEAKRQDVERIANVETCLSVLRHDITPFVSYLQNKNIPDSLRREVLDRLVRTFDNIKNWTNLSIPKGLQYHSNRFPIEEVFAEVSRHVVNIHPDQVQVAFEPTTLRVWGDPLLLVILLRNLVSNALQHTEQGQVSVCAAKYNDDPRFVQVTVSDTGCGLTPAEQEDLFRTDRPIASDPKPGSGHGFGLILSRYIIKIHDDNTFQGCRIWAESTPGEGSRFHFLVAADDQLTAAPQSTDKA